MTPTPSDGLSDETLALEDLQEIDTLCGRFELAWREAAPEDGGPSPETYLDGASDRLRPALLEELQKIDREYRARRLSPPPPDDTTSMPGGPHEETVDLPRGPDTEPQGWGLPVSQAHSSTHPDDPTSAFGAPPSGSTVTGDHSGKASQRPGPRPGRGGFPNVPGYEIHEELGRGGMGVVYKARQTGAERLVALKMILSGAHARPDELERFASEARAIARLNHPNIVQIFEVGEHLGLPFFSLEFVDGGTLAGKLQGRPLPPREAAELTGTLARAMQVPHAIKIVHRDLKPANILMTREGQPKVTDFGLAKRLDDDSGMTQTGSVMGTPSYMAPEQAWGRIHQIGAPADIYAMGAILYDLLTGRPPFKGVTTLETLDLVRHANPVPPGQLQPKLPVDLETICLKCLEKQPEKRYESALELAEDLQRFLDGKPILARPVSRAEHLWRWAKRNPVVAGLTSAVATLLVTVAVVSTVLWGRAETARANEADEREKTVKANAALAIARQEADRDAKTAQEQFDGSVGVVRDLILTTQDELRKRPELRAIRQNVLEIAKEANDKLRASYLKNTLVDRTGAGIATHLGSVELLLGRVREALTIYQHAEKPLRDELAKHPDDPVAYRNLATVLNLQGDAQIRLGDVSRARTLYEQGLALRRAWQKLDPGNPRIPQALAESFNLLGRVDLLLGDIKSARSHYQEAQALYKSLPDGLRGLLDTQRDLATLDEKLGLVAWREGHLSAAEDLLRKGLTQRSKLRQEVEARKTGAEPVITGDVALSLYNFGDFFLVAKDDPAKAWTGYQRSLRIYKELLVDDPEGYDARRNVAMLHYRAGETARRLKARGIKPPPNIDPPGPPATEFARSLEIREALATIDPEDVQARIELMTAQARVGKYAEALAEAEALRNKAMQDARLLFQASCGFALCASNPDLEAAAKARDRAFASLDALLKSGWNDRFTLETDPDLDPIRSDPRFAEILSRSPKTLGPGNGPG